MDKKQLGLLLIAVIAGAAATVLIGKYVTDTINAKQAEMQELYDAKQKQMEAKQQKAEADMMALAQELNRVKTEQAAAMQKQIADLQAKLKAQPPVPIKKPKPSLAVKTPVGKRAVTIKIDSLGAVGGLINPGESVDVIAHLNIPEAGQAPDAKGKNTVTVMVFQGLEVLAVNTNIEETGLYYDEQQKAGDLRVTVAVAPDEAGLLSFADKHGKMELALRSPQETDRMMVKTSTWKTLADYVLQNGGADLELPDELRGVQKQKEEAAKPDIQIFRGGKEL